MQDPAEDLHTRQEREWKDRISNQRADHGMVHDAAHRFSIQYENHGCSHQEKTLNPQREGPASFFRSPHQCGRVG